MSDLVVDSSVVGKWIFPEIDSTQADRVLAEVPGGGGRLLVLDLALAEVANAVWKRYYRGLDTLDEARANLDLLLQLPVQVYSAQRLLRPAFELAARCRCAVYDALFVALAQDLGLRGVTADENLFHATHADFPQVILLRNW